MMAATLVRPDGQEARTVVANRFKDEAEIFIDYMAFPNAGGTTERVACIAHRGANAAQVTLEGPFAVPNAGTAPSTAADEAARSVAADQASAMALIGLKQTIIRSNNCPDCRRLRGGGGNAEHGVG